MKSAAITRADELRSPKLMARRAGLRALHDIPRLLDEREALRAELWRIAFRAQRAQAGDDPRALAEIEQGAMEALRYDADREESGA